MHLINYDNSEQKLLVLMKIKHLPMVQTILESVVTPIKHLAPEHHLFNTCHFHTTVSKWLATFYVNVHL
jgi:hypothetical protein